MRKKTLNNARVGYLYLAPAVLFMIAFVGYPLVYNIILSFQDVTIYTLIKNSKEFIGLQNFVAIFNDRIFWKSLVNTFTYTFGSVLIQFTIGFLLALVYSAFENRILKTFRALTMIAYVIPITVVAILFKFMFANDGVINQLLLALGLIEKNVEWLVNGNTAMAVLIITNGWRGIPYTMILITAALVMIPYDVMEGAMVDGANAIQRFFLVKIPMIKASLIATVVLVFIQTFKNFDLVFTITGGGPVKATEILTTYAYRITFSEGQFGHGAAVTLVLFAILLIFGIVYIKLIGKDEVI